MTAFPNVPATITVTLLLNGTQTDISQYVYARDGITITGGQQDESSTVQPATLTLTLNNRDGRFSPNNTGGAYYPFLVRNAQISLQVTATSTTGNFYSGYRFTGVVADWPPTSDSSNTDVYVQITASGPLRQLRQGGGKGSALTRYYTQLSGLQAPVAYWPCEEDPDSSLLGAGIDGGTDMSVTAGTPLFKAISDFNGSAPVAVVNRSTWDGLTGSVFFSGDDLFTTPGTYTWVSPVTSVDAKVVGGGGGGTGTANDGGGGGGGEFAEESAHTVVVGTAYTVVVGGGGGDSAAGGTSSFDTTVVAHGGSGATTSAGGAGGTGSSNTAHHDGGAGAAPAAGSTNVVKSFTTFGTQSWKAPAGVTSVKVECWAGGGGAAGGGLAGGANSGGFGGGGGAYARLNAYTVVPGSSYTLHVGSSGSGGSPNHLGTDGGDSWWVTTSTCFAQHGSASTGTAAAGGKAASSTGDATHSGGNGGTATSTGGSGGGGSAGDAGNGSNGTGNGGTGSVAGGAGGSGTSGAGGASGSGNNNGHAGNAPGGGGGGGGGGSSAGNGGNGYTGRVTLSYTVPSGNTAGGGGGSGGSGAAGNTATNVNGAAAVTYGGPGGDGAAGLAAGSTPSTGPGGGGGGSGAMFPGASGAAGQVELVYTPPASPSSNVIRFILLVPAHGGNSGAVLLRALTGGTIAKLEVSYVTGGKLRLLGFASGGGTLFDTGSGGVAFGVDGQTLMVSVELANSGANVAYTFAAIKPGASAIVTKATGTVTTASCGNVTEVIVGPNADVTKTAIGHISVQYSLVALTAVSAALNGSDTEMGVDRFIRLCNEQALASSPQFAETQDHWGFEDATTQSFTAANGAVTNSTTWSSEGTHSLKLTANGGGSPSATSPTGTSGQPVSVGDIVSIGAELFAPVSLSHAYIGVKWYTSTGSLVSESDTADTVLAASTAATLQLAATAPATAAFFAVTFGDHNTDANNTLLYMDNMRVSPQMGPQTRDEYHKLLEHIKDLDQGIMRELRNLNGFGYRTRISLVNQSPFLALDYSLAQLSGVLSPVFDDQKIINDITAKRHKGSSIRVTALNGAISILQPPSGVGRYHKHVRVHSQADAQLLAYANSLLTLGTVTDERYPTIEVALHRSEVAALLSTIAGVEIGDYVQVINLPFWYPSTIIRQLVIGYTETFSETGNGAYTWNITWNCAPESPWEITATSLRRW